MLDERNIKQSIIHILLVFIMISNIVGTTRSYANAFAVQRTNVLKKQKVVLSSLAAETDNDVESPMVDKKDAPLYLAEGLFAVYKPLEWTSNDVVGYIRKMLEKDARSRGAKVVKRKSKKGFKVGHGGTLDPLATGVIVLGVGSGTKELQNYLTGAKKYRAGVELGYLTNTLDLEGNVTMTAPFDHVTEDAIQKILPKFIGKIMQIPPIFSAIRKDGKRLYEEARAGKTVDDIEIEPREVHIYGLEYIKHDHNGKELPCFGLNVECGGGTYIRSLVRDIGKSLDSVATMTSLERTQQGAFTISDAIPKEEWTVESIYNAIERFNKARDEIDNQKSLELSNQVDEETIEAV